LGKIFQSGLVLQLFFSQWWKKVFDIIVQSLFSAQIPFDGLADSGLYFFIVSARFLNNI
jgi:hypothetical protein